MNVTIQTMLENSGYRPSGFDYLRILLASGVIIWHSFTTTYGAVWAYQELTAPVAKIFVLVILPSFFTLSGFLVTGSLERSSTISTFLGLRVIRIVPALGVEVLLSALLLGPAFTNLHLHEYFHNQEFRSYFLNIVGRIHYNLPGVFNDNPVPSTVNSQLWTVPWELRCYITITVLSVVGVLRNAWGTLITVTAGMVALIVYLAFIQDNGAGIRNHMDFPGIALVLSLWGVVGYRLRRAIPYRVDFFLVSIVLYCVLIHIPYGLIMAIVPVSYMTLFIGLWNGKRTALVRTGDYSYGVYVYGFAIQQAIIASGAWMRHWYIVLPISMVLSGCFAAFSWFLVEKPALRVRRFLPAIDAWIISIFGRSGAAYLGGRS